MLHKGWIKKERYLCSPVIVVAVQSRCWLPGLGSSKILRIGHSSVSFESASPFNIPDYWESYFYIFYNVTSSADLSFLGVLAVYSYCCYHFRILSFLSLQGSATMQWLLLIVFVQRQSVFLSIKQQPSYNNTAF